MQRQKKAQICWVIGLLCLLAGCASHRDKLALRFHEQADAALPETHFREVAVEATGQKLAINPFPTLSEKDVLEARLYPTAGGDAVLLRFDRHGANVLNEMTTRTRGQYVVVLLNERPVAAVLLDQIISNGQFLLEGDFTEEQAKRLVADLNKLAGRPRDFGEKRHEH
jgi:preprotein translocase subunit SecD